MSHLIDHTKPKKTEDVLRETNDQARLARGRDVELRWGIACLCLAIVAAYIRTVEPSKHQLVDWGLRGGTGLALAAGVMELLHAFWLGIQIKPEALRLENLTNDQRRLTGHSPLSRKSFSPPPPKPYRTSYLPPTPIPLPAPVQGTPEPSVLRSPYSDLTPVGPYLSPPGSNLRDRITPGSSGHRRRSPCGPYRSPSLALGTSVETRVHELLEEFHEQDLRTGRVQRESPGYQMAPIEPSIGVYGSYSESMLPPASNLLVGKTGSPSEHVDASEWARTLQRLGIEPYRLSHYIDQLRAVLYDEVLALLGRFDDLVQALERYGVPVELLMDRKPSSQLGHSLEDYLRHLHQYDAETVLQYLAVKRIFKEGYNWRDLFDYVTTRLDELTEDSYLSRYNWSTAEKPMRDKNVVIDLPSDADILMQIFLWRCDTLSEHRRGSEADNAFLKQHFLMMTPDEESRSLRGRSLLLRHATSPPHFSVVENGNIYRIPRGRDNVFVAIVIFLYLARRDHWLPTYNQGWRRIMIAIFGSALHPKTPSKVSPRGARSLSGRTGPRSSHMRKSM